MATIQETIEQKFLSKLEKVEEFDAQRIDQIRKLLKSEKRPKAEDFIKIFSMPSGGDIK